MLLRNEDMSVRVNENAEGGAGYVLMRDLCKVLPVNVRLCSDITLPSGAGVGNHKHEGESEIYIITEGEAVYTDDGEKYTVKKGDVTVCPAGHSHAIENATEDVVKFFAIIVME